MKLLPTTFLAVALTAGTAAQAQTVDPAVDRSFATMDANKDGKIDRAEYGRFMQDKLDRQTAAMEIAFNEMDTNKNGLVNKSEAAAVPIIASAFEGLDSNSDGSLSGAEMRDALVKARAAEADAQ